MKNTKYFFAILAIGLLAGSVLTTERYVVAPGTIEHDKDLSPYNTWTNAATNIQWAVDVATNGDTVWVSNGTYLCRESVMGNIYVPITNQTATNGVITNRAMVVISNAITLKSVNGAVSTIIDGNWPLFTNRCVGLAADKAILDGFTIQHGHAQAISGVTQSYDGYGGGVYASLAFNVATTQTIKNCIIRENIAVRNGGGIHVLISGGMISNCQFICNTQSPGVATATDGGGGISMDWTTMEVVDCVIRDNVSSEGGGGISTRQIYPGTIYRNCLLSGNSAPTGGAIRVGSSSANKITPIESCTIVGNTATKAGGGFWQTNTGFTLKNTIIWSNSAPEYPDCYPGTGVFNNCCLPSTNEIVSGSRNITNHPLFVDFAGGNYRLSPNSPCMNTGTNQSWMTNGIDMDGCARIRYGRVDMGAYERIYEGTMYGTVFLKFILKKRRY